VPADPLVREATARLLSYRYDQAQRQRWFATVTFTLALGLETVLALTDSPWWWVGSAVFLALLGYQQRELRRLRRRREAFAHPAPR
jgi:hypothetical protein